MLLSLLFVTAAAARTPFCDICLCTSLPNEPPAINCISEEIPNIYDAKFWSDETNTPYPMKTLILHYNKLGTLETQFPVSDLKQLDLSRNSITKLGTSIFGNLQKMSTLILSHNKISYVNPDVFKGPYAVSLYFPLRALRKLNLEYNELHTLNADTFEHIDELEELNLSHNPFTVIDAQTMQAITSLVFLNILDLSFTRIKTLPEYILHAPKHLGLLDLSGNLFEAVPEALAYSGVTTLFFSQNSVATLRSHEPFPKTLKQLVMERMPLLYAIEREAFAQCANLSELDLNDNVRLTRIEPDALTREDGYLPISKFSMRNGNVSNLDEGLFSNWSQVGYLALSGNPWICSCSSKWFIGLSSLSRLRCAYPPELKGTMFSQLNQNQTMFQCNRGKRNKINRYITGLVILSTLLMGLLLGVVFYIRRKRRSLHH